MRITKETIQKIREGTTSYIVLYPDKELEGRVSKHYNGYWYERPNLRDVIHPITHAWATASWNGEYEVREDVEIAEVWIVRLKGNTSNDLKDVY